jgi:hypothetical protein
MLSTEAWAEAHGISREPSLPPVEEYNDKYARSARDIAVRAIILQGIAAVAHEVAPGPVVDWFHDQRIWTAVSPKEQAFLETVNPPKKLTTQFSWRQEAEWTLLWMIGKVDSLGLPTVTCDTRRLVDEIIPALGSEIETFIASSELRSPGSLLAEDDRQYNLWCYWHSDREGNLLPDDLNWDVLYERRYAFEWLDGMQDWDDVTCDS